MSLADLEAFVRLPGQLPLTRLQFSYQPRERLNEAFLLREMELKKMTSTQSEDADTSKEIDELHIKPKRVKKTVLKVAAPSTKQIQVLDI